MILLRKISLDEFLRLRRLVYRNARPLDYTKWKFLFENGSCDDFLSVLSGYQNEDGGFGYNIECNNWNPNSSPYTICIALDYLDTTPAVLGGEVQVAVTTEDNSLQFVTLGELQPHHWTKAYPAHTLEHFEE